MYIVLKLQPSILAQNPVSLWIMENLQLSVCDKVRVNFYYLVLEVKANEEEKDI